MAKKRKPRKAPHTVVREFMKSHPKPRTCQQQFDAALKCKTKEEADRWMSDEIQFYLDTYPDEIKEPGQAATVIMANLGYYAGYYSRETQQKIYDLFGATHPVFGTPVQPEPTPEEAFRKGMELGEAIKKMREAKHGVESQS